MRSILALAAKDLRLLLRDKVGFFFTFFFPLAMAVMFGSIMSGMNDEDDGPKGIPIVVIDEDQTDGARRFVETLQRAPEFEVAIAPSRVQGEDLVRRGRRVASVVITKGFGEAGERMFWGDPARLEVAVDPSRRAEGGMLQGVLTKYSFQRMQTLFSDPAASRRSTQKALDSLSADAEAPDAVKMVLAPFLQSLDVFMERLPQAQAESGGDSGANPMATWQPVVIEMADIARLSRRSGPQSAFAVTFPQGIVWGVIGACAGFGISLVVERARGTLVRLRMAPIGQWGILAGKAVACFAVSTGVAVALMAIGMAFFGVRPNSLAHLAAAIICTSTAFVGVMMLLACIGRTEAAAGGIGWAVMLVMAMVGGGMFPRFLMPPWLKSIGVLSPVAWSVDALEGAIWRDFTTAQMVLPCAVLLGIGVLGFAIGARIFRWTN